MGLGSRSYNGTRQVESPYGTNSVSPSGSGIECLASKGSLEGVNSKQVRKYSKSGNWILGLT